MKRRDSILQNYYMSKLPKYQGKTGSGQIGCPPGYVYVNGQCILKPPTNYGDLAQQSGITEMNRQAEIRRMQPAIEAELKKRKEIARQPKIGPARQLSYSEQVEADRRRKRLNEQYIADKPHLKLDANGDIINTDPELTLEGQSKPYTSSARMEKFARSWDTPFAIQGFGELAYGVGKLGARYLPQVGEYLTEGPLKNAYKYNPRAFKTNPSLAYRQVGQEGFEDLQKTGIVRGPGEEVIMNSADENLKQVLQFIADVEQGSPNYAGRIGMKAPYFQKGKLHYIQNLPEAKYLIETREAMPGAFSPAQSGFVFRGEGFYPSNHPYGIGVLGPSKWDRGLENFNIYKKHWWKGYKPITVSKPTSTQSIIRGPINYWEDPKFIQNNPGFSHEAYVNSAEGIGKNAQDLPDRLKPILMDEAGNPISMEDALIKPIPPRIPTPEELALSQRLKDRNARVIEALKNRKKKKEGGPVVNSNGYKDGRPSKGSNWRIPGNTVYNPTEETILAQANTGEKAILQPYDTNSVTFQDADYIDEYHLTDRNSNWLDEYKAKLGGPYNSSWMLTNAKPEPVYVPKMQDAGTIKLVTSDKKTYNITPKDPLYHWLYGDAATNPSKSYIKTKNPDGSWNLSVSSADIPTEFNEPYLSKVTQSPEAVVSYVPETKRAAATRENPNTPFIFPDGREKLWKDMDWREQAYVSGKNMGGWKTGVLPNIIDPVAMIGAMGEGVGTAPYLAEKTGSVLPYAFGAFSPMLTGALAGMGTRTVGQFAKNILNPLPVNIPKPDVSKLASLVSEGVFARRGATPRYDETTEMFQKLLEKYPALGKTENFPLYFHGTSSANLPLILQYKGLRPFGQLSKEGRVPLRGELASGISKGGVNQEAISTVFADDINTALNYSLGRAGKGKVDPVKKLDKWFTQGGRDEYIQLGGDRSPFFPNSEEFDDLFNRQLTEFQKLSPAERVLVKENYPVLFGMHPKVGTSERFTFPNGLPGEVGLKGGASFDEIPSVFVPKSKVRSLQKTLGDQTKVFSLEDMLSDPKLLKKFNEMGYGSTGFSRFMDLFKKKEGGWLNRYQKAGTVDRLTRILSPVVQTETRQPIYTSDLNDPRLRAYNDSLSLYKGYRNYDLDKTKPIEVYDKNDMATLRAMYPNTKLIEKKAQPLNSYDQWVLTQRGRKTNFKVGKTYSNKELALEQNKTEQYENKQGSPFTKNKGNLILDRSNRAIRSTTIAPIGMGYGHMEDVDNSNAGLVTIYKKPVQPVIYKKAINPKQKLVMGFQKFDDLDLPEQIQFKDLPQPRGGYKTAAPTPQMISETPTKYSYTYPSGNEQKTIYFPSKSTWKAFVDQYDGLNTTEQAGSFSATPGVYTRERRPNPVFKNIEYQIGGNLPKAQTGIEEPLTKPSVDWFKQWYQQRQTLPQFSRVAGKRLNLLSAPPKVELTPVEDLQKFGAIAEYKRVRSADPSQDVLSLADPATIPAYAERLQKERGKPFLRPVDLNLGTDPSVVGHEMSHWLDARAPQSTMLPIGANRSEPFQRYPIFEAANFKESGLDLPTYRWISNSRLTSIPGVKTEFNSVLNELRQREGLRGDQPTTPEQMKDIMDKYINLPEEKLYNQTTEGSQNDRIRTLIKYLQQDPVKLSELNNRIVGISKKGAPVAKNGGWLTEYKNGGQHGGLDRWFAEKWVDIKTGKTCGRQEGESRGYPACRPSKRVSSKTPKTSSELSSEERAKFKSSKTSSQRIPYSHKRRK